MKTNAVADLIRRQRLARGESQSTLAARLGTSQQVVSRVERGEGSLEQVVRHCRALALPLVVEIGGRRVQLVYPIDPDERKEIEANLDWFARLAPERRLRVIARHVDASRRLQAAVRHGR